MSLVDPETGEQVVQRLPVDAIKIATRYRTEFGDVRELADSILAIGLLHPVVVTPDHTLVSGHRRLEAVKLIGLPDVPVRVVDNLDSAALMLKAERDENTCRKDMTASELYALGKELEALERPKAAERQAAAGSRNLGIPSSDPENGTRPGETREVVGRGLGVSGPTWQRLKHVADKAEAGDEEAAAEMAAIDAGEQTITGAYKKVTTTHERIEHAKKANPPSSTLQKVAKAREMAAEGYTSRQIGEAIGVKNMGDFKARHGVVVPADDVVGKTRLHDSNRIVSETVHELAGTVMALALVEFDRLDPGQIAGWADSLSDSLRSLNRFNKQLKEHLPHE